MKKIATKWWIIGTAVFIVGLFGWSKYLQSSDPSTIARSGLHWHPQLAIYVKGEKVEIPQNIGIGGVHQAMHTHSDLPVIHVESGGVVKEKDVMLGRFFTVWGKDFNAFGSTITMTVNGKANTELQNYVMQDGDKIELRYD